MESYSEQSSGKKGETHTPDAQTHTQSHTPDAQTHTHTRLTHTHTHA